MNSPGRIPEVGSIWERARTTICDMALYKALNYYREGMKGIRLPMEVDNLIAKHTECFVSAIQVLQAEIMQENIEDVDESYIQKLKVYSYINIYSEIHL